MSGRSAPRLDASEKPTLITGGAGFIGTNLANAIAQAGGNVIIYDNLNRAGVERNIAWLKHRHGRRVKIEIGDIRESNRVKDAARRAGHIFHFAAQVAVTTSLFDPREDFEVNALGTLNILEAIRTCPNPPGLIFTSTNKVYGALDDMAFVADGERYRPKLEGAVGIREDRPLNFHSPYGCSKGTADQYVLDYSRSFGLNTLVLRMSCIYGQHQCGTEDQGWVAHFLVRALQRQPITIYGDGRQVRDILYVDDLVSALLLAQSELERLRGRAFNIGGGEANSISLLELLKLIEQLHGRPVGVIWGAWRAGDQRFYVSDHTAFSDATGWRPTIDAADGVCRLNRWLMENRTGPDSRYSAAIERRRAFSATRSVMDVH